MQSSDARTVRGVSLAVIILSVLSIIAFLIGTIAVGALGVFASDPSLYQDGMAINGYNHGYYDSLSAEGAAGLVGLSFGIVTAVLAWGLLCSVGTLIAGILGMRNHDNVEKLGGAFGWAIAGAVLALLSGRIITMILLIVAAVYINKVRNPAPNAYVQPMYAPQGYGQPYQQPQGYAQPYQQPQGYAPQPYQQAASQQPVQPSPGQQDPSQPQAPASQTPPDQQ